jgi:hypothetical protein
MKFICLTFLVFLMAAAHAKDCNVYGISDSPQKLSCTFKSQKIALSCQNGTYFLNTSKVSQAFHYEVEEGPVPLVFKAPDMQLTVVIQSKVEIEAELEKSGKVQSGKCH